MKKYLCILVVVLAITGCSKDQPVNNKNRISSTGELLCGYKENRVDENLYYSSLYQYKFDKNGILTEIIDNEIIEFEKNDKEIKKDYEKELNEAMKDYKDKKGVEATKKLEDKKYTMTITIDVDKLSEEDKEDYIVAEDRITAYKIFTAAGYTCE